MRTPSAWTAVAATLALALAYVVPLDDALAAGYLKIGDIKGESTDDKHKGEIEVLSWSWGEAATRRDVAAGSGMASGKRQHKPLVITKPVDKASPKLQEAIASGKPIPRVELLLPKEGGAAGEYVKYQLKNVYISSIQVGRATARDHVPTETFSLNYEEIKTTTVKRPVAAATPPERARAPQDANR